jgi:hypothetical protein
MFGGSAYLTSKLSIPLGVYSVRIKCNVTNFADYRYLIQFKGTNEDGTGVIFTDITTGAFSSTSGTKYVNGIASTTIAAGQNVDLVVSGITIKSGLGLSYNDIGTHPNRTNYKFLGSIDLIEIYQGTLSASEVANLSSNKRNVSLSPHGEVLGAEKLPTLNFTSGWDTAGTVSIIDADSFSSTGAGGVYKTITTIGRYYKVVISGNCTSNLDYVDGSVYNGISSAGTFTNKTIYYTATAATGYFRNQNTGITNITSVSIREVLSTAVPILHLTCNRGIIENRLSGSVIGGNTVPMPVVVDTPVRNKRMIGNGVSSAINVGTYDTMVGDKTIVFFGKITGEGENDNGRILDNGKLIFYTDLGNGRVGVISNGSTPAVSATGYLKFGVNYCIIVRRKSDGKASFLIGTLNSPMTLSGTADQSSGTPVAGTTAITILNDATGAFTFDGSMAMCICYNGLLSDNEAEQLRTSNANLLI